MTETVGTGGAAPSSGSGTSQSTNGCSQQQMPPSSDIGSRRRRNPSARGVPGPPGSVWIRAGRNAASQSTRMPSSPTLVSMAEAMAPSRETPRNAKASPDGAKTGDGSISPSEAGCRASTAVPNRANAIVVARAAHGRNERGWLANRSIVGDLQGIIRFSGVVFLGKRDCTRLRRVPQGARIGAVRHSSARVPRAPPSPLRGNRGAAAIPAKRTSKK